MTKPCRKCGEPKELTEFHKKTESRDGHNSMCKQCVSEYGKRKVTGLCECGSPYCKKYGHTLCLRCRRDKGETYSNIGKGCDICKFEADCRYRVRKKDANWMPYCFVTSKFHDAWKEEYA
jgi:hypothetical protein